MKIRMVTVFPGQGSQYTGMSRVLREEFPFTKNIYEEASDALKENLLKLCEDGPEDQLQLTRNAQPAILVTSYAWFQVLRKELDLQSTAAGGHSLGEYSALLASQALTLSEAVILVRKRGELMQSAVPAGKGKMAALLGLDDEQVVELCQMATQGQDSLVVPANFNAPGQVVIAGHSEAVDRAQVIAATVPAVKARKFIPLKVSAPFHSPLMKPVADKFKSSLQAVQWQPLKTPIAFNVDGGLRTEGNLVQLLTEQIDHPVQWVKCAGALSNPAAATKEIFVEMGPGKVLTGLNKRIVSQAACAAVDSLEDFKKLEAVIKEVSVEVSG